MGRVVIPGFRKIETSGGGEGGTTNYNELDNKPSINNVPLVGNLNTVDLKLTDATLTEEGVPAEAKTVGAKLEEQSTSLTAVKEELTKKVNVSDIPTKVSELQNDSNYQTNTDVTNTLTTYATKTYVGEQISSVDHLKREIVTEIPSPETADKNTIYMLKIESATGEDKYKEYLLIDGTLQCIGDTSVDLTDYAKKTEIPTELPANGGNASTVNGHTVKSDVPENAKFTDTVYDDTEVKEKISQQSTEMMDIKMLGWSVPKECPVQNEVNGNQFIQKVGRVDLGRIEWVYDGSNYTRFISDNWSDAKAPSSNDGIANIFLQGYQVVSTNNLITVPTNNLIAYSSGKTISIRNTSYTDPTDIKEAMQGQYLYYELATPITVTMDGNEKLEQVDTSLRTLGKCKNLLKPTLSTITKNGVTCTNNGDGTYTLKGTNNTPNPIAFGLERVAIKNSGNYRLVGCPNGQSSSTAHMYLANGDFSVTINDIGGGETSYLPVDTYSAVIEIQGNETVNLTFKPMITTNLNATYDDFVPYTGNSGSLNGDVASLLKRIEALEALTTKTDTVITE